MSGTAIANGSSADANGWYTVPTSRDTWGYTRNRFQKIVDCANAAVPDVNFSNYWGVIAVFPEAGGAQTTSGVGASDTTMNLDMSTSSPTPTVTTTNYFPTPPFLMNVDDCNAPASRRSTSLP